MYSVQYNDMMICNIVICKPMQHGCLYLTYCILLYVILYCNIVLLVLVTLYFMKYKITTQFID